MQHAQIIKAPNQLSSKTPIIIDVNQLNNDFLENLRNPKRRRITDPDYKVRGTRSKKIKLYESKGKSDDISGDESGGENSTGGSGEDIKTEAVEEELPAIKTMKFVSGTWVEENPRGRGRGRGQSREAVVFTTPGPVQPLPVETERPMVFFKYRDSLKLYPGLGEL